jgi:hypothetical protein
MRYDEVEQFCYKIYYPLTDVHHSWQLTPQKLEQQYWCSLSYTGSMPVKNPWVSLYNISLQELIRKIERLQIAICTEPGRLSYQKSDGKRVATRVGRFIKKFIDTNYWHFRLTEHQIQRISDNIIAHFWCSSDVEILEGEDIRDFYLIGPSSCMAHEDTQHFLDLYCDNPESIKLLTVNHRNTTKSTNHSARGLLWKYNGETYLDRIYYTSSACERALLNYAKDKGFKSRNDIYHDSVKIKVKIRNGKKSYWPYMDTLYKVDDITENQCTIGVDLRSIYDAQSTEGLLIGASLPCENCRYDMDENEDMVYIHDGYFYCETCYNETFTFCARCEGHFYNDDVCQVEEDYLCYDCRNDSCKECSECGETFYVDSLEEMTDGTLWCPDCAVDYEEVEEEEVEEVEEEEQQEEEPAVPFETVFHVFRALH